MAEHVPSRRETLKQSRVPTPILILGFIFVAGIGYVAGALSGQLPNGFNSLIGKDQLDLSSVQATYQAVADNFDGDVDEAKLVEGANRGLVDALGDQYTVYMNKKESTDFDDSLSGNIGGGIGVELSLRNGLPTVVRVLRDNPAEKAGVAVNDIVTAVNGESVKDKSTTEIVTKIRGDAGTTVKLSVLREVETKDFTITREEVNNPSVYGSVVNGVGVMTISRFDGETGGLARKLATEFKAAGVKGVVLDLRGNGGGYVTAAQEVGGIWLDKQVVVTEKRSGKVTDELKSGGSPILNGVPTVVLINSSSASASEIVAGALHDHKAATLMGEKSFGKGSVQKLVGLSEGTMLKVTVARWYTPSGLNISEKGITPDTIVVRTIDDINASRDPQLDAAKASF
ncbi:MAG: putative carboxyl-terminal protease [Candidatus Saccharibacteria bacterium]|nr:putative carboxyl-terminal protease [Candidatus Saccharibacteria bacterium]MDB5180947.1 putative carboxyl-terminal protease [Candidatus Saccharibacteria bacterium]